MLEVLEGNLANFCFNHANIDDAEDFGMFFPLQPNSIYRISFQHFQQEHFLEEKAVNAMGCGAGGSAGRALEGEISFQQR